MLPYVKINFANGAIGREAPMDDGCTGLICTAANVDGDDTFGIETPYLITSLRQLEALGVSADPDDPNARLHKCVKEFYDEAPQGTKLYVMGTADDTLENILGHHQERPLLVFAKGEIRTLVAVATATSDIKYGLFDDVYAGIPLAQTEAEWAADELKAPLLVLLEGRGYTGDPTELHDISELECNRVAVVIGDTEKHAKGDAAAVGLLAGRLAAIPVQRSAARVRDGAVKADAMFILGDRAELGQPEAIHDKGFICPRTFAGKAGYYWSDDLIAAPVTDDYCLIPRRRTIDKAARVAYAAMLEYVNDEIAVTAEGKIVPSVAKDIETVLEGAIIKNMTRYGNLSTDPDDPSDTGVVAYVDPDQDIVRTSHLDVTLRVRPYGYAKYIEVDLGFQTLNS